MLSDTATNDDITVFGHREFKGNKAKVTSVTFSHNGKLLVTGSDDGTVILWDLVSRREGHKSY